MAKKTAKTEAILGVVSLIASTNPTLYPYQVREILKYTGKAFPDATSMGSALNCNTALCGGGITDARRSLWSAS